MHAHDARHQLDRMAEALSRPLPPEELAHGWTEEARRAILDLLARLRADLAAEVLPEMASYTALARGMDHWGITGGELLEQAAQLSAEIRRLGLATS